MRDISLEKTHSIRFEISQSCTAYVKFRILNFGTIFITRIIWLLQTWHLNTNGFCTVLWTTSPQNSGIQLLSLLGVSQGSHTFTGRVAFFFETLEENVPRFIHPSYPCLLSHSSSLHLSDSTQRNVSIFTDSHD